MERTYLHRCAAVTNPPLVSVWHCQADARLATATFCISTFAWVFGAYVLGNSVEPKKSSADLAARAMPTQRAPAGRFAVVCLGNVARCWH